MDFRIIIIISLKSGCIKCNTYPCPHNRKNIDTVPKNAVIEVILVYRLYDLPEKQQRLGYLVHEQVQLPRFQEK